MIYGIGSDLVAVSRIEQALEKSGERFLQRILTVDETAEAAMLSANQTHTLAEVTARFVAKRFAVKEALSKAFGTGIGSAVGWQDVGVGHHQNGAPLLVFSDALQKKLALENIGASHVSISDEVDHVLAFVILEKK